MLEPLLPCMALGLAVATKDAIQDLWCAIRAPGIPNGVAGIE